MVESDLYGPLHDLLGRLDRLLEARDKTREDVLNVDRLAAATGLTRQEVGTLLRGRRLRARQTAEYVPQRVRLLCERHEQKTGKTLARMVGDLTAGGAMGDVWARKLLQGERVPSVPHLGVLADYFGVPVAYFMDSAPVALARELRPIVDELEEDPLDALMDRFGIQAVHARTDGRLTPSQRATIAGLIEVVLRQEEGKQP